MASGFSVFGATPSTSSNIWTSQANAPASTPQAKALNYAALGQSPAPTASPSTPIKSQVHTDNQGNSVKTTYAEPTGAPNQTQAPIAGKTPGYIYTNGVLTSEGGQPTGTNAGLLNSSPQGNSAPNLAANLAGTNSSTQSQPTVTQPGTTPTPVTPPSQLGQATTGLLNSAGSNGAIGQSAANIASDYGSKIADVGQQAAINEESVGGQGLLPVAMGRAQQIAQTANSAQTALAQGESAALQGTGQQLTGQAQTQSGLAAAGALASPSNQFLTTPYSNEVLDASGNPVGGGATGTLPASAQSFVSSLASQVQSGQMTRTNAESELSAYGPAGLQALNTALGPSFNTNASNASGATTATGQQLQTQATAADSALDTLSQQFNALGNLTGATGFQPLNSIEQTVGGLFGNSAVSQYQTTLQEARAKISGVLAASGGVTPTTADEMAKTYLPDGMTPSQLPAKIAAAKTLIQQSVLAFTNSGNQNSNATTSSSGGTVSAGGYSFVQNAQGQWVPAS